MALNCSINRMLLKAVPIFMTNDSSNVVRFEIESVSSSTLFSAGRYAFADAWYCPDSSCSLTHRTGPLEHRRFHQWAMIHWAKKLNKKYLVGVCHWLIPVISKCCSYACLCALINPTHGSPTMSFPSYQIKSLTWRMSVSWLFPPLMLRIPHAYMYSVSPTNSNEWSFSKANQWGKAFPGFLHKTKGIFLFAQTLGTGQR